MKTKKYFNLDLQIEFLVYLVTNKMTEREFAKKAGFSAPYLSMIINNKKPITDKIIEQFKKGGFEIK